MSHLIAVVDDDESIRDSVRTLLRSAGYRVATFESAEAFLDSQAESGTACLILDVRMPRMSGLELQIRLNHSDARIPIIFITAHDDGSLHQSVARAGALDLLHKPFAPNTLLSAVRTALAAGRTELDPHDPRETGAQPG